MDIFDIYILCVIHAWNGLESESQVVLVSVSWCFRVSDGQHRRIHYSFEDLDLPALTLSTRSSSP